MTEYDLGYAIVRVHTGRMSEAERHAVIEEAAKRFYTEIEKSKKGAVTRSENQHFNKKARTSTSGNTIRQSFA